MTESRTHVVTVGVAARRPDGARADDTRARRGLCAARSRGSGGMVSAARHELYPAKPSYY
jgi:hypothetical protein